MNYKSKSMLVILILLAFISTTAQNEIQKKVKEKLKEVNGNIESLTIKTNEGETTFEGKEAELLYDRLKSIHKTHSIFHTKKSGKAFFFDDDTSDAFEKVKVIKLKDGDHDIFFDDDGEFEWTLDSNDLSVGEKRIEVKIENGEKTVIVTSEEDGETKVDTLTGSEADKYLENHSGREESFMIKLDGDDKDTEHVFIKKMNSIFKDGDKDIKWIMDDDDISTEIKVEIDDSLKTITVISDKDGEEKVKVYTGKDADKFLNENGEKEYMIKLRGDKSKTIKIEKLKSKNTDTDEIFEWIDKNDEDEFTKKIKFYTEDGTKKLIITTIDDGEETSETYDGEEAEQKFEELKKELNIKADLGDNQKIKKIIIK